MFIALDFDGTVVYDDFPNIGKDIGAIPVLKKLVKNKHKLILNTMRSGKSLDAAIKWFKDNDIPLFGINKNPIQSKWTTSPKVYAHIYIDDKSLGIPLVYDDNPYVDWKKVKKLLKNNGIL